MRLAVAGSRAEAQHIMSGGRTVARLHWDEPSFDGGKGTAVANGTPCGVENAVTGETAPRVIWGLGDSVSRMEMSASTTWTTRRAQNRIARIAIWRQGEGASGGDATKTPLAFTDFPDPDLGGGASDPLPIGTTITLDKETEFLGIVPFRALPTWHRAGLIGTPAAFSDADGLQQKFGLAKFRGGNYLAISGADPSGVDHDEYPGGRLSLFSASWTRVAQGTSLGVGFSTAGALVFPAAAAAAFDARYWSIWTRSTEGDLIVSGRLATPHTIDVGATPRFAAGKFGVGLIAEEGEVY